MTLSAQRDSVTTDLPLSVCVLERGWLSSNSVLLFDDAETATLIDSGYAVHAEQTVALVRHALGDRRLARIVNTHLHSDHCGGNAALQRTFEARIVIPPGLADAVQRWDTQALSYAATGQRCDRFGFDALLRPGERLTAGAIEWQVLAAPGHDPHSIVLWSSEHRILISADALWENGFGAIFPELEGDSGFAEQQQMLQLFARLAPKVVIPGHGPPFTDVEAALARAQRRLDALRADPARNARHAAKVLVKFLLLAEREIAFDALVERLHGASYLQLINAMHYRMPFEQFVRRVVDDLVESGAVSWRGETVVDRPTEAPSTGAAIDRG